MKFSKILLLLLFICLYSCNEENPVITETGNGKVIVLSNIENGEIFIDDKTTNRFTPDTLELLAVNHRIKVRKKNYFSDERIISINKNKTITENFILKKNDIDKYVLLESFTNSGCDFCKNQNEIFDELKNKYQKRLLIINYPLGYPYRDDPMYNDASSDVDLRKDFYGIFEPSIYFVNGMPTDFIEESISSEIDKKTKFVISVYDSLLDGSSVDDTTKDYSSYKINTFIDVYDLDGNDFNQLDLYVMVIEEEVVFDKAPGKNGETLFKYILRKILKKRSLGGIKERGRVKFYDDVSLFPLWQRKQIRTISFIQNKSNKEILQVAISDTNKNIYF